MEGCGKAKLSPDLNPAVLMAREMKQADHNERTQTDKGLHGVICFKAGQCKELTMW